MEHMPQIKLRKIEGYWKSTNSFDDKYPMPIPNVLTEEEANKIWELIKKKERQASRISYRGFSQSRIDNSIVGSQEFQTMSWIWPDGFADHYVKKYRVKPSDEFLEYIGYKGLEE